MNNLSKIVVTTFFLAIGSLCTAMDIPNNSLKNELDKFLSQSPSEAFLVVTKDPLGLTNSYTPFYTKITDFREDQKGTFVNSEGNYLQMFKTLDTGHVMPADQTSTAHMITACSRDLPCCSVIASTSVTLMDINLSACALAGTNHILPFQVLDTLGLSHAINMNFNKTASDTWMVTAQTTDGTMDPTYTAGFNITFDCNGNIASVNGNNIACVNYTPQMTIYWNCPASPSFLTLNFGTLHTVRGLCTLGSKPDLSTPVAVDGHIRKYLKSTVDPKTGHLIAEFTNGFKLIYGKVPVITFETPKINLL